METQLLEQEPRPGRLVSETERSGARDHDAGVRQRRACRAQADHVQDRRSRPVGGPLRRDSTCSTRPTTRTPCTWCRRSMRWATARSARPALQRFLSTRRANADVSFTALHRGSGRRIDARRSRDAAAARPSEAHEPSPRRWRASRRNRTALKGYLASLWNSPMTQYRGLHDGDAFRRPPARAARGEGRGPRQDRPATFGRDVPGAVWQRERDDVRARRELCPRRREASRRRSTWAACPARPRPSTLPRRRPALPDRADRSHAAGGLRQQCRYHRLHRGAPLLGG